MKCDSKKQPIVEIIELANNVIITVKIVLNMILLIKKMRHFIITIILFCSYSGFVLSYDGLVHTDIDDVPWANEAINYLDPLYCVYNEHFRPHDFLDRIDIVPGILYWFQYEPLGPDIDPVFMDTYTQGYILRRAKEQGIIVGDGNGNFYPKRNLTREDAVVILYRIVINKGGKFKIDDSVSAFLDTNTSEYAKEPIEKLHQNGIVTGRGNALFHPKAAVTRAEIFTMAYNTLKHLDMLEPLDK